MRSYTVLIIATLPSLCHAFAPSGVKLIHMEELPVTSSRFGETESPLCFGERWKISLPATVDLIRELRNEAPDAFVEIPGHENDDCLFPTKLPLSQKSALNAILELIAEAAPLTMIPVALELTETDRPLESKENDPPKKNFLIRRGTDDQTLAPMRNSDRAFGRKVLRAQAFILPATAVVIYRFLKAGPEVSNWSAHPSKNAWHNFTSHLTQLPVVDHDGWTTNYIEHPYSGSIYYNMVRTQGASPLQSLGWAFVQSTSFEYGFESFFEKPSLQDFFFTPLGGMVLGEAQYQLSGYLRDRYSHTLNKRNIPAIGLKVLLFVINPSDVLNNGFSPRHHAPSH